jgi:glucose-6-phosphate 1-dehydrogenase
MKRVFVLFGSTGDLAKRKIYPALKEINKDYNFELIAVGRQDLTKEKFLETCVGENNFGKISYRKIINSNKELPDFLREIEKNDEIIFYLSTPPKAFYEIVEGFSKLDLKNKKYKIVFEKPFVKIMLLLEN